MNDFYPLRFRPIFRQYLWGGRRLGTVLGKPIGKGDHWAESWEVVDHGADQSVVANGSLAGMTLSHLVRTFGAELMGRCRTESRFPLLLKYLDCHQSLSIQVHPPDEYARKMQSPDLGKTEAWYVIDAEPGSRIYAGLPSDVTRDVLNQALEQDRLEDVLHSFQPRLGDCIFVPAGTVHALGGGLLVAEIQQSSDATFRLYDWNRIGPDGRPRPLQVDQALDVIDFDRGPVYPLVPQTLGPGWSLLVEAPEFELYRGSLNPAEGPKRLELAGDDRCWILTVVQGEVSARTQNNPREILKLGETMLFPAAAGKVMVELTDRACVDPGSIFLAVAPPDARK